jgi:hypothetical protein
LFARSAPPDADQLARKALNLLKRNRRIADLADATAKATLAARRKWR